MLRRGRLHIANLTAHTNLTKRQVQHGLAVLIQQSLIFHYLDDTDGRTYYEANYNEAYALIRAGKIVEIVDGRFGEAARDIVQDLLYLGLSTVADLEASFATRNQVHANGDSKQLNGVNGVNGVNGNHHGSVGELHATLAKLLEAGFVQRVSEKMFRSSTDTLDMVEREIQRNTMGTQAKSVKQKEELKAKIRAKLKSWRDEDGDWTAFASKAHGANGVNGQGRKRKLSRSEVNGNHGFEDNGFRFDVGFDYAQQDKIAC